MTTSTFRLRIQLFIVTLVVSLVLLVHTYSHANSDILKANTSMDKVEVTATPLPASDIPVSDLDRSELGNKAASALIKNRTELLLQTSSHWYVGTRLGLAATLTEGDELNERLRDQGLSGSASSDNSTRLGANLNLGWQWHPNWAIEAGYTDLGNTNFSLSGTGALSNKQFQAVRVASGSGIELALKGKRTISQKLQLYGRVGAWQWEESFQFGSAVDATFKGSDVFLGLGLQRPISARWKKWYTSIGWDGYRVDNDLSHLVSFGLHYRFGYKNKAIQLDSYDSELIIQNTPDTTSVEFIQKALEKITHQLTFASNKSQLTIAPKQLRSISQWLTANPKVKLKIIGHTDNSGSELFNTKLASQRAAAFASLLQDQGVSGQQLIIDSAGAMLPIADNATEAGRKMNRRVELLLQESTNR